MGSTGASSTGDGIRSTWKIFTYKELHNATNGFSEDNKLGEGGFGSVYWGKTSDGLQVLLGVFLLVLISYNFFILYKGDSRQSKEQKSLIIL